MVPKCSLLSNDIQVFFGFLKLEVIEILIGWFNSWIPELKCFLVSHHNVMKVSKKK